VKISIQKIDWSILLHDIRSVQNVASIFRLAEVFGVSKILLSGITPGPLDRFNKPREDFLKISLGTEEKVRWERIENVSEYILNFKNENGTVIALEQAENSVDYKKIEIDENKKYLVVPGREVEGLDEEILKLCDLVAEIPQYGEKESLNIFSATSICVARFFDR
jgi:tRNA G18 (ribose-2'-O)-methylase SpoU